MNDEPNLNQALFIWQMIAEIENISFPDHQRFTYALARNKSKLKSIVDDYYSVIEKSRLALCNDLAKKDGEGNPITENGQFVFDDKEEFVRRLNTLNAEYTESLSREPCGVKLHKVKFENVPPSLTIRQMEGLMPFIIEEEGALDG